MVKIISICSGKGGVGKTVVASNLSVALTKLKKRVIILDFNFTTPHLSLYFGLFSNPITLNNFLRNEVELIETVYNHPVGLDIVPSSLNLIDIVNADTSGLRESLKEAFWDYDYIILDSAPGLGKEALVSLKTSDEIIFVANPQIPSLVDVVKCSKVINSLETKPKPLGVIVNRVKGKNYETTVEEIKDFIELPLLGIIPEDEKIPETENKKTLVTIDSSYSPASKSFFEIASKLSGERDQYGLWDRVRGLFRRGKKFS
jgi:cell division ATPase MinD